jgi:hypothetical protein
VAAKPEKRADALYIRLNFEKPQKYTRRLNRRRVVNYAEDGTPVRVELLFVSKGVDVTGLPEPDLIARILAEHKVKVLRA